MLKDMICRRKSVRSYTDEKVDETTLAKICDFIAAARALYPEIGVQAEIVEKEAVKCIMPWTTPQSIAIFSEEKEGFLENVGFIFQQVDLYLQSLGLGSCWLGMGRLDEGVDIKTDKRFVIILAFGHPKDVKWRDSLSEFKRHTLPEIADREDARLEPARLAPSAVNSQPWYFTHEGDTLHVYCRYKRMLGVKTLAEMNRIDMGIALAHLYVSYPDTFTFTNASAPAIKNCDYIGTVTL